MTSHRGIGILILFATIAGCAGAPPRPASPPPPAGYQRLSIVAYAWILSEAPSWTEARNAFPNPPTAGSASWQALAGASCTARNAKGSWEAVTPGTVEVAIGEGSGTLTVECRKEGFRPVRQSFQCITPRTRNAISGALAGLQLMALFPPAVLALAPATAYAALVGVPLAGAAIGTSISGADLDVCNYVGREVFEVTLEQDPPSPAAPAATAPGHQRLSVVTLARVRSATGSWDQIRNAFPNPPPAASGTATTELTTASVPGATCTARNALGFWQTVTPGAVEVAVGRGAGSLAIECRIEGWRTARLVLLCLPPTGPGGEDAGLRAEACHYGEGGLVSLMLERP